MAGSFGREVALPQLPPEIAARWFVAIRQPLDAAATRRLQARVRQGKRSAEGVASPALGLQFGALDARCIGGRGCVPITVTPLPEAFSLQRRELWRSQVFACETTQMLLGGKYEFAEPENRNSHKK